MKILVAEDSPSMRGLVTAMLKKMGYRDVLEAEDGGEAWNLLSTNRVDLLLTDWNMPVLSGFELLEKVRQLSEYEKLPVLIFTGRSTKEDVLKAVRAGTSGYLTKPFSVQHFTDKIRTMVNQDITRQAVLVLKNKDALVRQEKHPLLLFGEEAVTIAQLVQPERETATRFLLHAVASFSQLKRQFPDFKVGYGISTSSIALTKSLRSLSSRVKLLVVSTDLPGGGVTLARLAMLNNRSEMRVMVVCHNREELSSKERSGLERLGIFLIERAKFKPEEMAPLINEFVFARSISTAPIDSLPPVEIRKRLERDIQHMVDLPVLPQVYNRIVELDRDRDSDIGKWIQAIETDPLCQAQVIRRACSPMYGFRGRINEVGKAVMLMGKIAVKELVVSGVVRRVFAGDKENKVSLDTFWTHSVAVAVTSRLLAFPFDPARQTATEKRELEEWGLSPEVIEVLRRFEFWKQLPLTADQDPYVGGMMHDIGKAALVQAFPGLLPMIVEHLVAQEWRVPMLVAEEAVAGGANHSSMGHILAENWKLGTEIEGVVANHHLPEPEDNFAGLIALADFIAGGIYPYPRQAAFPTVQLISKGAAGPLTTAPPTADAVTAESPPVDPLVAARGFLPEGLLDRLSLDVEALIALGGRLAPSIRNFTENMRRSI